MNLVKKIVISSLAVMISGVVLAQDPTPPPADAGKTTTEVSAAVAAPEASVVKDERAVAAKADENKAVKKAAKKVKKAAKKSAKKMKKSAAKKANKAEKEVKKTAEESAAVEGADKAATPAA